MADGQQQGFQSFDDLDKFLKTPPAASSAKQQPATGAQTPQKSGGFDDFSSFDSFIQQSSKAKKPDEKPASWSEVSFMARPFSKYGDRGPVSQKEMSDDLRDRFGINVSADDPRLHKIWLNTLNQIDPVHHPFGYVEHLLGRAQKGMEGIALMDFPAGTDYRSKQERALRAAMNEPYIKNDPEKREKIKAALQKIADDRANEQKEFLQSRRAKEGASIFDPDVMARAGALTYFDWESMGVIFKPLEIASEAAQASKAARRGLFVLNQALGAKFSYDSFEEGNKLWGEGRYGEALSAYGGSAAMLLLPTFHHVMNERGITEEQVRQRAYQDLEEAKQKVIAAQKEKPNAVLPISPQFIEDMQYRIENGLPMFGIGRPTPMDIQPPEHDLLGVGEKNLQTRLARENLKSEAQQNIVKLERQQQEVAHQRKLASEQAKTEAEKRELMKELDAREKALADAIKAENERFKVNDAEIRPQLGPSAVDLPPSPKRPFFEPLELSPNLRPMTREERETEWLEERRKRYQDLLEKEREDRRRRGDELQVVDRRRFAMDLPPDREKPVAAPTVSAVEPEPPKPQEVAEKPVAPAVEPLAPPPLSRREIQEQIAAAAWQNIELESRKAKAKTPEEIAEIESQMDHNRSLAADLVGDRMASSFGDRSAPKKVTRGEALKGPIGKTGELKTVTQSYPIRTRVVEGADLKTSHNPIDFEPVEGYPENVQERDYKNDKDAQIAVIQHAQKYDPNFTLSDAPGPEHGPPMVTPDGVVLGGNSRAMSTMRLYAEGRGNLYRDELLSRASQLGLKPEEIKNMKQPVLVREILNPPEDVNGLRALGSDLNKVFTRKLSEFEQAVSAGKRISQETLDYILQQLTNLGDGATIRDLLRERSRQVLEKLESDGVIASTERRAFINEQDNTLNDTGKDFIENAILGSVIDDPLVLANSPKSVLRNIERSLSSIARLKARGGLWDISDYLKEAVREHISAAAKGIPIEEQVDPPMAHMFIQEPIHPIVKALALKLDETVAAVKKAFDGFAEDAELDVKNQGTMAFFAPPKPWDSFKQHFKVDVRPQEWGTVKASPPTASGTVPAKSGTAPGAPLEAPPKSIIEEEFDRESARIREEEGEVPYDLGEIPSERSPLSASERFRAEAEQAFPKVNKEQMDAVISIMEARAKSSGRSLDQWIEDNKLSVESQSLDKEHEYESTSVKHTDKGVTLKIKQFQIKGHVEFMEDGRAIIRAFTQRNPEVATLIHEVAHVFRRDLKASDLSNKQWLELHDWAGVKHDVEHGTIWTTAAEEKFARGFERYLRDGVAPSEVLRSVFERFKTWLANIYDALKKNPINIKLSSEVRQIFDKMLTSGDVETRPLEEVPEALSVNEKPKKVDPEKQANYAAFLRANLAELRKLKEDIDKRGIEAVKEIYSNDDLEEFAEAGGDEKETLKHVKRIYEEEIKAHERELAAFPMAPTPDKEVAAKPLEEPPKRREIEIPDPGPKKRSEFTEIPSLGSTVKGMTDEDLRSASKSLETQINRKGLSRPAREQLEKQAAPFREELKRRNLIDRPEKSFGEKNEIFTKARADAARERLRNKLGKTLYSGIDPELVRDVSEIMGYYFEGGIREFPNIAKRMIEEFGEAVRPLLQSAYDQMLNRGKVESRSTEQKSLFETPRSIVLPPGAEMEVRRGETQREGRPPSDTSRKATDAGTQADRPEAARQDAPASTGSERGTREPAPGRGTGSGREGIGGGGVVERFEQPLRNVQTPKLDVEHIRDIPYTVEPTEWKGRLKDANLPENLPPPTETLSPATDAKLAFKGQPEIVQTVLTSLRKYNGAILATSTGTGKTYMGSAVMAELRPRMGLVITPSRNIAQQWIDTAQLFGVEMKMLGDDLPTEPGIYVTTYSTATGRKGEKVGDRPPPFQLAQINWNAVIADESHFARRWHDPANQRGKFIVELSKASDKVLYTSATPFHTPLELGYFEKLGLWKKTGLEKWLREQFGVRAGEGGKWIVPMNYRKLAALREELISRGMFVNLDRNMEGYTANFAVVPMSRETTDGVRNATQAFRMAEEYFKAKGQNKMVMAVRGNATTFMKSYLERQRLPEAIELGKKLEREGWKVIYFTESKKEVAEIYDFLKPADEAYGGEISQRLPRLPGVVDTLKEAFGEELADFTGAHSSRRQNDLEEFNRGDKKHLVATYGAGGVGVSLHDLSGENPRAVIYLGPPWSGVMFDQAVGRPWRFGTKSNVSAYYLTSNAQPEMRLIFQKVLPRFESLKASVSGIKKTDPIVSAMKDLDAYLAYEFGNDTSVGFDQFMNSVQTSAVSSYKEVAVTSAEEAKNKGMRVERRQKLDKSPETGTLFQANISSPPPDLPSPEDRGDTDKSSAILRRPFVSESTERDITDPRLLDQINDHNMASIGIPIGGERPPGPPSEIIGNTQIPRPGESEVRRDDLAAPKVMQRVYEFAEKHFGEWGVPAHLIDTLAKAETGVRLWLAQMHTSPYVLRQFPETEGMVNGITNAERLYRQDLGNLEFEKVKILQEANLVNDSIGRRKVDQALRMTDQGDSLMSLLGQPSKWLDGSVFKESELRAAQRIRDEIYEPIIEAVRDVRPDVGYRRKYSAVIKTMEDLAATLYPELNGKVPADLMPHFSLEIRRAMTRDPFSPHILKRRGEPPKTFDIDDVLEAYVPSMLKVKHYTKLSRKVAGQLASLPDSMLKEYATKYARIFFGVPSEYKRMDRARYQMAKTITDLSYGAALEANPLWFTMHLTKVPVNTFPELGKDGARFLAKGYERMMTEDGRELVARQGVLLDRLWVFPETFFELKKRPRNWLRLTTSMSDAIDRSASYLAALEKAKDMGFLGPKENVGEITWERLNELAANGVNIDKAFDYANSVMSRSEFLYTPSNVQMWQREHPILGMFKHYIFREAEFVSNIRKIAKEVKGQSDPELFIQQKVSEGHYEYIDAVAKYRRLLISLTGAAAIAAGIGGPLFSRFWPFHLSRLLSTPVMFAEETMELVNRTIQGKASEKDWIRWTKNLFGSFVPYAGFAIRTFEKTEKEKNSLGEFHEQRRRQRHRDEEFAFDPIPQ